jgi:hypothetical protein
VKLDPPQPGDVIRYAYLFQSEHEHGKIEARKERPALVVALAVVSPEGKHQVLAVAITHTPQRKEDGIELPSNVKTSLGLDEQRSWIVATEANSFRWPGPDLRAVPGRKEETPIYGRIPTSLLQRVAQLY